MDAILGSTSRRLQKHVGVKEVFNEEFDRFETRTCERGEGVQGVLTLFCSGAAQVVFHALRVEELREQLEVEEEDGDRQEEREEVESGEANQRECAMWMTMDGV